MSAALLLALAAAASGDVLAVKKSCDAGKAADCTQLAISYLNGRGVKKDMASAAAAFRKACGGGNADGCTGLGSMHAWGQGMATDEARAAELFKQGCDGGDPHGCMQRGFALAKENRVPDLPALFARAADLAGRACDKGQIVASADNVSGCFILGGLYEEGWGVRKDVARAAGFYERGCMAGDAQACDFVARMYRTGSGVPKDLSRAEKVLEHACDTEHKYGCGELASVAEAHLAGSGVPKDVVRAAALFQRACDNGASGCGGLGDLYASGKGVSKDPGKAAAAYKRACDRGLVHDLSASALQMACDLGSGTACRELSRLRSKGSKEKGVARDEPGAVRLLERACDAGLAEACSDLRSVYAYGEGVAKDEARAASFAARGVSLEEQGCGAGDGEACYRLGNAYRFGIPVAKDPARAAELFKQACNSGSSSGCRTTFEK